MLTTQPHLRNDVCAAYRFALDTDTLDPTPDKPAASRTQRRVVIVERVLTHYRVDFFERLREHLAREGVALQLLVGHGTAIDAQKKDGGTLDWAIPVPGRYWFGDRLYWQPFGSYARQADLVIVMHENKMLYNLWLLFFKRPVRLAFWGHGRNMQSHQPTGLRERFKRWTINKVDWWFAYTDMSAALIHRAGFPQACTTVVDNAVDTDALSTLCNQVTAADCHALRTKLSMHSGPVGMYLGSLYQEKRLDFLLAAAQHIRQHIPDFQLLIAGAGPEQAIIEDVARRHRWIHYVGPLYGKEKATALVLADVLLNPGLVGLGILDSFVSGTPMFTTDCGMHSPEISYLDSGHNGVMTVDDINVYAQTVIATLSDPDVMTRMSQAARASAPRYTVQNMATRFGNGILACLAMNEIPKEKN